MFNVKHKHFSIPRFKTTRPMSSCLLISSQMLKKNYKPSEISKILDSRRSVLYARRSDNKSESEEQRRQTRQNIAWIKLQNTLPHLEEFMSHHTTTSQYHQTTSFVFIVLIREKLDIVCLRKKLNEIASYSETLYLMTTPVHVTTTNDKERGVGRTTVDLG